MCAEMFRRCPDEETRRCLEAVAAVEKHFGELCQLSAAYVRKAARLRDQGDLLASALRAQADAEAPCLRLGLSNFAHEVARIQDYRQAEIDRLEAQVVAPLKAYGLKVKMKRADLDSMLAAKNREAKHLARLGRLHQRSPRNPRAISQEEMELQRAARHAAQETQHLREAMEAFQRQKIKDIKNILSEFMTIEMLFYGKALEIATAAYQHVASIDEDEVFQSSQQPPDDSRPLGIEGSDSRSAHGVCQEQDRTGDQEKTSKQKMKTRKTNGRTEDETSF